jgi:hypothetical protein
MFIDTPRTGVRAFGALGSVLAVIATMLPWYSFDVIVAVQRIAHIFQVPESLWGVATVAPVLIVVGSVAALICLTFLDNRIAGIVTALVGVGIVAYGIYRCINIPALGVKPANAPANLQAATVLEAGPFISIAAGWMLTIAGIADFFLARDDETELARPTPHDGVAWEPADSGRVRVR